MMATEERSRQFTYGKYTVTVYLNGSMQWTANFVWPDNVMQYPFGKTAGTLDDACDHARALIDAGRIH